MWTFTVIIFAFEGRDTGNLRACIDVFTTGLSDIGDTNYIP